MVTYQPSGGQYDYIEVRVPKVELKWTYEFWYTPVNIPVYWGMGYNYYAISDLEFKFSFRPPQYHYGSLGNGDISLDSSTNYGSVSNVFEYIYSLIFLSFFSSLLPAAEV